MDRVLVVIHWVVVVMMMNRVVMMMDCGHTESLAQCCPLPGAGRRRGGLQAQLQEPGHAQGLGLELLQPGGDAGVGVLGQHCQVLAGRDGDVRLEETRQARLIHLIHPIHLTH